MGGDGEEEGEGDVYVEGEGAEGGEEEQYPLLVNCNSGDE